MKISVLMPTYNHQDYILRAVESVFKQKTSYDIELMIADDCSPDQTHQVMQEFIDQNPSLPIVYKRHSKNIGLLKNYRWLIENCKGEYIAILESDDYWIDPSKTEKQISFLDKHGEYLLSCTGYKTNKNGKIKSICDHHEVFAKEQSEVYEHLLLRNIIKSPTVIFRKKSFLKYCDLDKFINKNYVTFDYPTWLTLANYGKIHYSPEVTAFYSFVDASLSNNQDLNKKLSFENGIEEIRNDLIKKYGKGSYSSFDIKFREAVVQARYSLQQKKYRKAISLFLNKLT